MTSRRPNLADQARAVSDAAAQLRAAGVPSAYEGSEDAPRARPIRISTDLAPVQFHWLKAWLTNTAVTAHVADVKGADVIRALLDELRDDPELDARVRAAVINKRR